MSNLQIPAFAGMTNRGAKLGDIGIFQSLLPMLLTRRTFRSLRSLRNRKQQGSKQRKNSPNSNMQRRDVSAEGWLSDTIELEKPRESQLSRIALLLRQLLEQLERDLAASEQPRKQSEQNVPFQNVLTHFLSARQTRESPQGKRNAG